MCLGLVGVGGEQVQASCSLSLNRKVTLLAQPRAPKSPDGADLPHGANSSSILGPLSPPPHPPRLTLSFWNVSIPQDLCSLVHAKINQLTGFNGELQGNNWRGGMNNPFRTQLSRSGSLRNEAVKYFHLCWHRFDEQRKSSRHQTVGPDLPLWPQHFLEPKAW